VAFGINGFGAVQTNPAPSLFQALSIGNALPLPPNPPYGNPNPNLVNVRLSGNPSPALPANLTLAAQPTQEAILKISSQAVLAFDHPPLPLTQNTTTGISATNPTISRQIQGPSPDGIAPNTDLPSGAVSFVVTSSSSSLSSGADALEQTIAKLQQGQVQAQAQPSNANTVPSGNGSSGNGSSGNTPPGGSSSPAPTGEAPPAPAPPSGSGGGSKVSTPAPASPGIVAKIVSGIQSLAIATVYPSSIFSFSA
jgi:hypothetical protein